MDAKVMLSGQYLNAQDLRGRPVRVTISRVDVGRFRDGTSKLILSFEGARKQLVLNKTNLRAVIAVLGTSETEDWVGQRLTLEPKRVDFGGQLVDAVRVASPAEPPARPAPAGPPRETGDDGADPDLGF
jgi:hypothetical protein